VLERPRHLKAITSSLRHRPIVALLGPRQCGKSTLARSVAKAYAGRSTWFDLEDPQDVARLAEPTLALKPLRGLVVLDEIQRRPEIFPILRVLADRSPLPARFLVLGSAAPDLLRQSSETLAGRIAFHHLSGFDITEVGPDRIDRLWLRGAFPRSFLAKSEEQSLEWRENFLRTFLERDVPSFGIRIGPSTLVRFFAMLAHWHGNIWNSSEFARAFGVADTTVRGYLDVLGATFVARLLTPFAASISKRQIKSPKVYVRDSGLLHSLLRLRDREDLERHPQIGASFEGFAIEQIIQQTRTDPRDCYYWRTQAGAELDLLIVRGRHRHGFEIKRTASPKLTPSMRHALDDLDLDRLDVIHLGEHAFDLAKRIRAVPIRELAVTPKS
jgi:predicted AAA+ superfamily ATPase